MWRPRTSLAYTILWLVVVGLLFLGFGVLLLSLADSLIEVKLRYDDVCGGNKNCAVEFTLDREVTGACFLYYQLTSFAQNHRKLFDSRSYTQLEGKDLTESQVASCGAVTLNKHLNTRQSIGNNFLDSEAVAYPCGGLAKAFFTGRLRS